MWIVMITESIVPGIPKQVFDSGKWHQRLFHPDTALRVSPNRVTLFLPSGNGQRHKSLLEAVYGSGIKMDRVKRIAGPTEEIGDTPLARAWHKISFAVKDFTDQGYWERHPHDLTFLVAVDSRDKGADGKFIDKPQTLDEWQYKFYEDWLKVVAGERVYSDVSGYAALAILGNMAFGFEYCDGVRLSPKSREIVAREFASPDFFEHRRGNAHGLNTGELIRNGDATVTNISGQVILGKKAVERTYGASVALFTNLLGSLYQRAQKIQL